MPQPGVVEHDPEDIWSSQLTVARAALAKAKLEARDVSAIGITNQRETTILWEKATGRPVANAIVWQSRVTAPLCDSHRADGHEEVIRDKTGLVLDAYFSASKIEYLLDTIPGLRARAERGEILFGTVDTFLIWRFSGRHVTDPSNASRTMLFDLHALHWDDELLRMFRVPRAMLPEVVDSSAEIARTKAEWFGSEIPILGIAGDQQAATFGQACFTVGHLKNTYGTGCFTLMNIGHQPVASKHRLLTTVGWRITGKTTYCLEGAVFVAGAAVQWLRDGLGLAKTADELARMAAGVPDSGGVMFVPAMVGLGAPYWDPHARGTIVGITRGTTAAHFARAAIDAMAYQTCDLLQAMRDDLGRDPAAMNVDGGASVNNQLMQFQADLANIPVRRPRRTESTAWGAAALAGLAGGIWNSLDEIAALWQEDRTFTPAMEEPVRTSKMRTWNRAVERSRAWTNEDDLRG
ncbi:MAG: glycerol kinase GlpK [Pirellulales bacterium]